jgi:hypothetical protein
MEDTHKTNRTTNHDILKIQFKEVDFPQTKVDFPPTKVDFLPTKVDFPQTKVVPQTKVDFLPTKVGFHNNNNNNNPIIRADNHFHKYQVIKVDFHFNQTIKVDCPNKIPKVAFKLYPTTKTKVDIHIHNYQAIKVDNPH